MRPTPEGWPRITPSIFYEDPAAAIPWIERAFGFETRLKIEGPNGSIAHSELAYGDGLIMVGSLKRHGEEAGFGRTTPRVQQGANTQSLFVLVDDVDAHCKRARAAGATVVSEPVTTDYGADYWSDRMYEVIDCEGHRWWFAQRMRTGA